MSFFSALLFLYALLVAGAYFFQRKLIYFPDISRVSPSEAGLAGVEEIELEAPGSVKLVAWHLKAAPGKQTLLYFHGNAGNLSYRAGRIRDFARQGIGVFMLSYRGYGGSGGEPSERNFVDDGLLAFDYLVSQGMAPGNIVLYGESLGGGVAVQTAARRKPGGLVLEAAFSSAVDVGARAYWFLPVRLILKDRFESVRHIGEAGAPVLIMHGAQDRIVPASFGRKLYKAAREPKKIWIAPQGGHEDLFSHGALQEISRFLDETVVKQYK